MKNDNLNSRRSFIGSIALGAAAGSLTLLSSCKDEAGSETDASAAPEPEKLHEADEWFKGIKGKHRIVYDGSTPHDGFAIAWNWAFYLTNNQTGTPDEDMTAVSVLRHNAIPFALEDRLWEKYKLGEFFGINGNVTKEPLLRNPYYEPQEGDFILPPIEGIKRLQERGAMFCVCDLALNVYSGFIAQGMDLEAADIYKDFISGVHPGIQIVPSGVWALGRAQELGCGYIFAGN
jgi:intracellular sulfur oxidation DsrE/DsrF family protein